MTRHYTNPRLPFPYHTVDAVHVYTELLLCLFAPETNLGSLFACAFQFVSRRPLAHIHKWLIVLAAKLNINHVFVS